MNNGKHWIVRVQGKVQGVFYRKYTQEKARQMGLKGYVRNEDDGSVLIEAEGEEEQLKGLIDWCKEGPPAADVNSVDISTGPWKDYKTFEISY